jgi:hypothetical protein
MIKMKSIAAAIIFIMSALISDASAGGVQGRVAIRGEVVEGVGIYAYKNFDTGLKGDYFKVSSPTKIDGTYKLDLPAGRYYFVARKTKKGGVDLSEGDLYCYYNGSPIYVADDAYKNVGFNMIKVPAALESKKDKKKGVYGFITFKDKPLERVYLFAYKDAAEGFKGPADYVFPSEKGRVKLRLPEGEFYLIARKRKKGGMYGPIEKEDIFNYYYGNPVKMEEGTLKGVLIECITRLDMLEPPVEEIAKRGITAHVKDEMEKPLKGLYLLLYTDKKMAGKPEYVSESSDENGKIFIELNVPGKFYLIVRSRLGGPAQEGEYYSKYQLDGSGVTLQEGDMYKEISFKVKRFTPSN